MPEGGKSVKIPIIIYSPMSCRYPAGVVTFNDTVMLRESVKPYSKSEYHALC